MGFPPPPDAPAPDVQAGIQADASFEPSPVGASLCGFQIPPTFSFSLAVFLPPFPPELPLPFNFALSLNCDLSNPIDAEFSFGGGRVSTGPDPNDDPEFGPA